MSKVKSDDDDGLFGIGNCLGVGGVYTLSEFPRRVPKKNPIGFIWFPERTVTRKTPAKRKPKQQKQRRRRK